MSTTIKLSQVLAALEKRASLDGSEHIILSVGAENKYAKPDDLRTYVLANVQNKLDKIGSDDMHVRYLGAATSYDDITSLVKAIDLSSLDNQGLWYVSMNGVRVLLNVEIKYIGDTSTAARAIVTLYGGVSVNGSNSLSQDLALHILTISYDSNGWGEWKEYYNAADLAKAQTDITALQTRATAAEKTISAAQSSITDLQGKTATLETKAATAETNIKTLQTKASTAETNITALQTRATTAESSIKTNAESIKANATNIAANAESIKANAAGIATNTAGIKALESRTQGVSATDLPTRYLGAAATYDDGAALLKALSLADLSNQGYWYFSMNGVRILCQLEIKAINSRAVATIYGGVKVGTDGSLTQDGAYHILATYCQDGTWAEWAEYFDASKLAALEARVDEMQLFYGVEWDTRVTDPTLTRIGSPALHRTLPIQSQMRGCLLADDGTVSEYLPESDWTSSTRDGSRGQVMVEIPRHWRKCETDGTVRRVKLSTLPLPGYKEVPLMYVSAYEAALDRTNKKLASVVNTSEQYRGGNGTTTYDADDFSFLGRPVNIIARPQLRQYARERNAAATAQWNAFTYQAWRAVYWLFAVEYATRNCQLPYNAQPTAEGYRQGGLGPGVTTIAWGDGSVPFDTQRAAGVGAYTGWAVMCWYNPFVPCGHTDSLGNGTGVVSYTLPKWYGVEGAAVEVPRYRGLENLFGHLQTILDGCNIVERTDGTGMDAYVTDAPSLFNDEGTDGYALAGTLPLSPSTAYIKDILLGDDGHILCKETGGGSTSCFCDAYNGSSIGTYIGCLHVGDRADAGGRGGLSQHGVYEYGHSNAQHGSRLTFHP